MKEHLIKFSFEKTEFVGSSLTTQKLLPGPGKRCPFNPTHQKRSTSLSRSIARDALLVYCYQIIAYPVTTLCSILDGRSMGEKLVCPQFQNVRRYILKVHLVYSSDTVNLVSQDASSCRNMWTIEVKRSHRPSWDPSFVISFWSWDNNLSDSLAHLWRATIHVKVHCYKQCHGRWSGLWSSIIVFLSLACEVDSFWKGTFSNYLYCHGRMGGS